jgi:hypothetical protein
VSIGNLAHTGQSVKRPGNEVDDGTLYFRSPDRVKRPERARRFPWIGEPRHAAMAAGLADHVWSVKELLEKVIPHGTEAMAS